VIALKQASGSWLLHVEQDHLDRIGGSSSVHGVFDSPARLVAGVDRDQQAQRWVPACRWS